MIKKNVLIVCAILCVLFSLYFDVHTLYILSLVIVVFSIVMFSKKIEENYAIVFFLCTFVFFLMSSEFVQMFFNVKNERELTAASIKHSHLVIFIGIIALLLGYRVHFSRRQIGNKIISYYNQRYRFCAKNISKNIFYTFYVFQILPLIEIVFFVASKGYSEYFLSYHSRIPVLISALGDFSSFAFAVFLASMPTKKEAKMPILLYLFSSFLTFMGGKRYYFVASLVLIFTYFIIRNKIDKGNIWISKKQITLIFVLIPFAFIGLYAYTFVREGNLTGNMELTDALLSFFNLVGESDKVIKYGYMYKDQIPDERFYCFGGLIDYFRLNEITKLFTGETMSRKHTVEYALNGNSFSYILTYIVTPNRYESGYGLGSCYLAELYQDGGYVGVAVGSFFYGVLIKNIFNLNLKNVWRTSIMFYLFVLLLRAPRDSYSCFLEEIVNLKFIVIFLLIKYFVDRKYKLIKV